MAKPTIAEIIAAKKAAANKDAISLSSLAQSLAGQSIMPVETMAAMIDAKASIDRIDPPGKFPMVLSAAMPLHPADIAQKAHHAAARKLSQPLSPAAPLPTAEAWGSVLGCTEQDLCIMRDPADPETCWLAVRHQECNHAPILILRLPWTIWEHPQTIRPEDIPY